MLFRSLAAVEQALTGKAATPELIAAAAARAADGLELRDVSDAAYKANLAAVYTRRALTRAVDRARSA